MEKGVNGYLAYKKLMQIPMWSAFKTSLGEFEGDGGDDFNKRLNQLRKTV